MRQCYRLEQMKDSVGIGSRMEGLRIESDVMEEEEEEEDTLSLSDLSTYNDIDSEEWEKYYDSKSNSSSTSSSSFSGDEDLFEFNSEEWNKNAFGHNPPENILFCGKLIPYRINPMLENTKNKDANEAKTRPEKRSSFVPKGKSTSSRWYIFLFGFPTHDMELKDLKNRQSCKVIASSSPSSALCPSKNGDDHDDKKTKGRGKKGMWRLIKALSCGGGATYQAQSVVKASIGCISLV